MSIADWEFSLEMVLHPEEGRRSFFFREDNANVMQITVMQIKCPGIN